MKIEDHLKKIYEYIQIIKIHAEEIEKLEQKKNDSVLKNNITLKPPSPPALPKPPVSLEKSKSIIEPEKQLTINELNDAIAVEYYRLNENKTDIENIIKKYGAHNLSGLDPANYNKVLNEIKAL